MTICINRGSIFETFIVSELVKARFIQMQNIGFYFWRDSNGNEIDLISDFGGRLMPIEIKSGQTLNRDFFSGLERWMALAGDHGFSPTLVYGGAEPMRHKEVNVYSWRTCPDILEDSKKIHGGYGL